MINRRYSKRGPRQRDRSCRNQTERSVQKLIAGSLAKCSRILCRPSNSAMPASAVGNNVLAVTTRQSGVVLSASQEDDLC